MTKPVSKILLELRDNFIAKFKQAEKDLKEVKEDVFNHFYQKPILDELDRLRPSILDIKHQEQIKKNKELLADKTTGSIYGAISHLYDTAFFTVGLDVLDQEARAPKLDALQLSWLNERLSVLQQDIMRLTQRLALMYLKNKNVSIEADSKLDANRRVKYYQEVLEIAKVDRRYSAGLEVLQRLCTEACEAIQAHRSEIEKQIGPQAQTVVSIPVDLNPATETLLAPDEKRSSSDAGGRLVSSPSCSPMVVSSDFNPFMYGLGWQDAHHPNLFLYCSSNDYRNAVATRDLTECCINICCSPSGHNALCCWSCGQQNCACPDSHISHHALHPSLCAGCGSSVCHCIKDCCTACGTAPCHCLTACCSGCGNMNCRCDADCMKLCGGCGGAVCFCGVGAGSVGGTAANNANNAANGGSQGKGLTGILVKHGGAYGATHTTYLTEAWQQYSVAGAYGLVMGPRLIYNFVKPLVTLGQAAIGTCTGGESYKVGRAGARLLAQVLCAGALAGPLYFPVWGGLHTAVTAAGTGAVIGDFGAKKILQWLAFKNYNGISNPEKWILNSAVLREMQSLGVKPERVHEIILDIKKALEDVKQNRPWYKKALNTWWDNLPGCVRGQVENALNDAMKDLRGGRLDDAKAKVNKDDGTLRQIYSQLNAAPLFGRPPAVNPNAAVAPDRPVDDQRFEV